MTVIIFIIIVLIVLLEIIRELHSFKVTHYTISSKKFEEFKGEQKVVFLSDLHNQTYGADNERLIKAIKREKPDMILIGGDMLIGKQGQSFAPAFHFVSRLVEMCPVYYANGNHEQRMKECPENFEADIRDYFSSLKNAGVCLLENEFVQLMMGKMSVRVYGLEIPAQCYSHFKKERMEEGEIERRIGGCDAGFYNILLAHNPGYMKEYKQWGADLILSGHLHGGLVRIPGFRGVITPDFKLFPKYCGGRHVEGKQTIVVSKGLGTHTVRIRLFDPAEVVVLHLPGQL